MASRPFSIAGVGLLIALAGCSAIGPIEDTSQGSGAGTGQEMAGTEGLHVDWREYWVTTVPDVYITVGAGSETDPAEVERELTSGMDERWGDIKYLAVSRLDADTLLVHIDGVSELIEVEAVVTDIRSLGPLFDFTSLTVGE